MFRVVLFSALALLGTSTATDVPLKEPADQGIVGGISTIIENHPYQVSLEKVFIGHHCGGSLLKPNVVLTAAHCTENGTTDMFKVRAGITFKEYGGAVTDVLHIFDHPKYDRRRLDYDVAVLILERSFLFSAIIQPIELQPIGAEVLEGAMATVTGWGRLWSEGLLPIQLQKVVIPKYNLRRCATSYLMSGVEITERMDCYGYPDGGRSSCQGDSGGPIVVNGKQVGVVSFGMECAHPLYPSVFAKISNMEIAAHIHKYMALF